MKVKTFFLGRSSCGKGSFVSAFGMMTLLLEGALVMSAFKMVSKKVSSK